MFIVIVRHRGSRLRQERNVASASVWLHYAPLGLWSLTGVFSINILLRWSQEMAFSPSPFCEGWSTSNHCNLWRDRTIGGCVCLLTTTSHLLPWSDIGVPLHHASAFVNSIFVSQDFKRFFDNGAANFANFVIANSRDEVAKLDYGACVSFA